SPRRTVGVMMCEAVAALARPRWAARCSCRCHVAGSTSDDQPTWRPLAWAMGRAADLGEVAPPGPHRQTYYPSAADLCDRPGLGHARQQRPSREPADDQRG